MTNNLALTDANGNVQSEMLTDPEIRAIAHFISSLGWAEFSRNATDDAEAYLKKQAFDKLQDILARAGFAPR